MRVIVGVALLAATLTALAAPAPDAHSRAPAPRGAWVDVSVATVWTNPGKARGIDHPALTNPVDVERWPERTTTAQKLWLSEHDVTQTQALYGTRVDILGARPGWYEVAVPGQPTPKNPRGYPGWIPADQLSFDTRFGQVAAHDSFALIDRAATTWLYDDPALTRRRLRLSYDTRLPVLRTTVEAIEVALPSGGSTYLSPRATPVLRRRLPGTAGGSAAPTCGPETSCSTPPARKRARSTTSRSTSGAGG